jgi:anti-sigma factor RsiW
VKKCGIKEETLVDYLYGEIGPGGEKDSLEEHIRACPECRAEIKKLEALRAAAESMKVDFSPDIWDMHRASVMKGLKKIGKRKNFISGLFGAHVPARALLAAALIVLLAGAGVTYFYHVKAEEQQKVFAEKAEMLQNLDVIERLDFYEKISEN